MEGKHVQTALPVLSEKPKKLSSVVFRRTAVVMGIRSKREWTSLLIKANITSNKLQKFEAVSKLWKRHRSHHIQNVVPNVMARHQLLDTTQAMEHFLSRR